MKKIFIILLLVFLSSPCLSEEVEIEKNERNKFFSGGRVSFYMSGDGPVGFRFQEIKEGSLAAKLGIEVGDILIRGNGIDMSERIGLVKFSRHLAKAPGISLVLLRNEKTLKIEREFKFVDDKPA